MAAWTIGGTDITIEVHSHPQILGMVASFAGMIYDGYDQDAGRNVEPYIIIYNPIVIRIKS